MFKGCMVGIILLALCFWTVPVSGASKTPKAPKAPNMQAGLWGVTFTAGVPGTLRGLPVRYKHCMTKENFIPQKIKTGCTVSDIKTEGNTVSWRSHCEFVETEGKVTYEGTTFEGYINTTTTSYDNQKTQMRNLVRGEYIGPCE